MENEIDVFLKIIIPLLLDSAKFKFVKWKLF